MNFLSKLKKTKKQRILVVSAGGPQSGIQGMYFCAEADSWELLAHAELPYPGEVEQLVESLMLRSGSSLEIGRIAWLDHKLTHLFLECAKTALSHAHKSVRQPHLIVMNRCTVFKGRIGDGVQAANWDVTLGDAQLLASTFKVPVITDFCRHGILAGTSGELPLLQGNIRIVRQREPVSVFLNIGLIAHLSVVDNQARNSVLDSDVGPGTCLINLAALDAGCPDRFDRDGSFAARGKVDNNCVTALLSQEWFLRPPPKRALLQDFTQQYQHPLVSSLSENDRIATLTAFTARAVFEFFKREYHHPLPPEVVWVSGGGAHNLTLLEFLGTYFDPVKVKSVEEIGIPAALRIPLSLGLTVHEYCAGRAGLWKAGANPEINGIGRWVFP